MSEPRTPPAVEREYLSMAELATYSGMSRRWLEERLHNAIDALPSFPFGRRLGRGAHARLPAGRVTHAPPRLVAKLSCIMSTCNARLRATR